MKHWFMTTLGILLISCLGCGIFDIGTKQTPAPKKSEPHVSTKKTETQTPPKSSSTIPVSKRGNNAITSFSRSKKTLMDIHKTQARTFYCGCRFGQDKRIDLKSCGYKVRKSATRAGRVEFEHVVPASTFGHSFSAWKQGHASCKRQDGRTYKGRRCVEKVSKAYKLMQADMYNLQPAIGEVNGDRNNYRMAMMAGEPRAYGACDVEIKDKKIEPKVPIRGDIARTYLYMAWAYPDVTIMSADEKKMFLVWSKLDPVSTWERQRAARIKAIQGNDNPYIK